MPSEQAKALAAMVLAHYPGEFIAEMNVLALADTLDRIGMDIAEQVVDHARLEVTRPPSSAQLYAIARQIRAELDDREQKMRQPVLPPGTEMPAEVREHIRRMVDPERKRREADAEIAEQDAEWQRKKAAVRSMRRMDVCAGVGKIPVELEDGTRVCPDCGTEVPDIIAPPIPKPDRRTSWKTGERW